ncbi:hypothetical protein EVG20_g3683 [Dentipellis fragilis]|uniref:beta-N-acetylhexosaminidase n=1 Tax=Dentipellis fragilis TaxID=205917 RepID=A0A4Y9YZX6_9AGAM|nr:hypothetical protein EVG20_g3683 [Dentipellis fragilis]
MRKRLRERYGLTIRLSAFSVLKELVRTDPSPRLGVTHRGHRVSVVGPCAPFIDRQRRFDQARAFIRQRAQHDRVTISPYLPYISSTSNIGMPSSFPPPPLDLSAAEHFSDLSDWSPYSSSRRPTSQCSFPRTVSRSGSWADITLDGNPSDYVSRRLPSLCSISDVFPEGPFIGLADKQEREQEQRCHSLNDGAHADIVRSGDTAFEARVSGSSATPKLHSADSGPEYSSDETGSTTSRNSSYRSRRSGFYGSPSSSVTPLSQPTQSSACASSIDLSSYSALARFVFDLRNNFSVDAEDIEAVMQAMDDDVIPEIESPGHALVITQWKPELALSTDPSLLNISFPDTIPTVKSIWQEFLPWLHSKQVSIGADEYDADLADDYNNFVNTMSYFIWQQSKKTIRIWGTNEPSNRTSVSKNITIQHWEFFEDDPFELIRAGYRVINSDDAFQYIVLKESGSYPQQLNQTRLWDGANTVTGGIWDPHVFDRGNSSNNPTPENPLLAGSIMAAWNDPGPNATTYLEAFYSIKAGLPVIAAANWQAASRPNHLTQDQYLASFPRLEAAAPAQNLDRRIKSAHEIVVEYNLTPASRRPGGRVKDGSGNNYDGTWANGSVKTPLGSKGHNYTFLVEVGAHNISGPLLTGPDDSFGFTTSGNGSTLAFTSSNTLYPLLNYTFPASTAPSSREIIVTGTEDGTSAFVDGQHVGDFVIAIDGNNAILAPMAFVAPVQQIGGAVTRFVLWDGVQNIPSISRPSSP